MGLERFDRPLSAPSFRGDVAISTAASTAVQWFPNLTLALQTTSTGAPVVYDLIPPEVGDRLELFADTVASSSLAPYHINLPSGFTAAASSADMITLSTVGTGLTIVATSTTRIAVVGNQGAAFATST